MATSEEQDFSQKLEFQTFSNSATSRPSAGALSPPIGSAGGLDNAFTIDIPSPSNHNAPAANAHAIWHIQYYAQWFNVDSNDVVARIGHSIAPITDTFFEKIRDNPDLYGPVWISSTVIFMLAATGNFATWLQYTVQMNLPSSVWSVDVSMMTFGASIIYLYTFVVPIALCLALRYAGARVALVDLICLYGYSLFIYIPASVVCMLPNSTVQWISVTLACFVSTTFVVRALRRQSDIALVSNRGITAAAVLASGVLSIALAVVMKLYLFQGADPLLILLADSSKSVAAPMAAISEAVASALSSLVSSTSVVVETTISATLAASET